MVAATLNFDAAGRDQCVARSEGHKGILWGVLRLVRAASRHNQAQLPFINVHQAKANGAMLVLQKACVLVLEKACMFAVLRLVVVMQYYHE